MNIFITATTPSQCAADLCDTHLRKMIVETAQLLSTAHYVLDGVTLHPKPTNQNHPCAIWVRDSVANYEWAWFLFFYMLQEYQRRFDKPHNYAIGGDDKPSVYVKLSVKPDALGFEWKTPYPKVVPSEFYRLDTIEAYRATLNAKFHNWMTRTDKRKIIPKWTNTTKPYWVTV